MTIQPILALVLLCAMAPTSQAALTLIEFGENNLAMPIPDYQSSGIQRTVTLSGLESQAPYLVTVSLKISATGYGAYNGDFYAYLRHVSADGMQSQYAVLLNRVGRTADNPSGYDGNGLEVTLADDATTDIHLYGTSGGLVGSYLTGAYQPDGRTSDPNTVLGSDSRTAMLNNLGTMDPNGSWTLFVADMERGGTALLAKWGITLTPVPEPNTISLLYMGLGALALYRRRRR